MANTTHNDDHVQHGIDDNSSGDAEKGAALGGLGGLAVGAAAGSLAGPVGTVIGAVVGGISGALASGAAVAAVDAVDNDNSVSGVGHGTTGDINSGTHATGSSTSGDYETGTYAGGADAHGADAHGHNVVTGDEAHTDAGKGGLATGAIVGGLIGTAVGGPVGAVVGGTLGSLTGGVAGDASEAADDLTPNRTGSSHSSGYATGANPDLSVGNNVTDVHTNSVHTDTVHTSNVHPGNVHPGGVTGGYYGNYDGRDITRAEYDALPNDDRLRVRLLQEELHVDKTERQVGEVEVGKRIVSEQVQVPVTLEREEVVITRRTIDGVANGETIGDSETIVVPVREEFAEVTKTAHVSEEVEIEKRVVSENRTVSDTVRHEELDVTGGPEGRVRVDDQSRGI